MIQFYFAIFKEKLGQNKGMLCYLIYTVELIFVFGGVSDEKQK